MENLNFQKNQEDSYSQNTSYLLQKITQHYLDTAALARKEDQIQVIFSSTPQFSCTVAFNSGFWIKLTFVCFFFLLF